MDWIFVVIPAILELAINVELIDVKWFKSKTYFSKKVDSLDLLEKQELRETNKPRWKDGSSERRRGV